MKLNAGDSGFPLPEPIDAHSAELMVYSDGDPKTNPQSRGYAICRVDAAEIAALRFQQKKTDFAAMPVYFAIFGGDRALLYPTCDREYFAEFWYHTAKKVI